MEQLHTAKLQAYQKTTLNKPMNIKINKNKA